MPAVRSWKGVPAEQRHAERQTRLIEAGLEEIGTRGYDATTVKAVCRGAGLTERYFYEHFADRLALLGGVYNHVIEAVMGATLAATQAAPDDLAAKSRAGLDAFFGALEADPRRARVQLVEVVGRSTDLEQRRLDVQRAFADQIVAQSHALLPRPEVGELQRRATALALVGGTNHIAVEWLLGGLGGGREHIVEPLVALYVAAAAVDPVD